MPFGLTADELAAWVYFGGDQKLWDEVDAPFNIKPLMATQTGTQMGGWFTKESTVRKTTRGCAIACRVSAPKSCAVWASSW